MTTSRFDSADALRSICAHAVALTNPDAEDLPGHLAETRQHIPYENLVADLVVDCPAGPDAVLLGMPRCGTSWLHWQCFQFANTGRAHFKEINFLAAPGAFDCDIATTWKHDYRTFATQYDRQIDAGMLDMTRRAIVYHYGPRDWDWYGSICASPGETKGLDLTPNNFVAETAIIAELKRRNSDVAFIAILRDPLERAVSVARHVGRRPSLEEVLFARRLRELFDEAGSVHLFYYDDLMSNPSAHFRAITGAVGISLFSESDSVADKINASSDNGPVALPAWMRRHMRDDIEGLDGVVPGWRLDQWRARLERPS